MDPSNFVSPWTVTGHHAFAHPQHNHQVMDLQGFPYYRLGTNVPLNIKIRFV